MQIPHRPTKEARLTSSCLYCELPHSISATSLLKYADPCNLHQPAGLIIPRHTRHYSSYWVPLLSYCLLHSDSTYYFEGCSQLSNQVRHAKNIMLCDCSEEAKFLDDEHSTWRRHVHIIERKYRRLKCERPKRIYRWVRASTISQPMPLADIRGACCLGTWIRTENGLE